MIMIVVPKVMVLVNHFLSFSHYDTPRGSVIGTTRVYEYEYSCAPNIKHANVPELEKRAPPVSTRNFKQSLIRFSLTHLA